MSPEPRDGSAPPTPSSLIEVVRVPSRTSTRTRYACARSYTNRGRANRFTTALPTRTLCASARPYADRGSAGRAPTTLSRRTSSRRICA